MHREWTDDALDVLEAVGEAATAVVAPIAARLASRFDRGATGVTQRLPPICGECFEVLPDGAQFCPSCAAPYPTPTGSHTR